MKIFDAVAWLYAAMVLLLIVATAVLYVAVATLTI